MAKQISKAKAKKILRDGSVNSQKLTARQKRFFGAIVGGQAIRRKKGKPR